MQKKDSYSFFVINIKNGVVRITMNFLFFSAQFLPHMGGVENYTYNISKKLIDYGHQVTIVTSNTTKSPSIEIFEGINVFRLDCYNLLNGRFPIYKKNKIFRDIFKRLDQQHYDFCIINTRFYFHSLLGAKYTYKHSIPRIVIDHGTSHLTVHNKLLDYMGEKFEHFLTWQLKKYCKNYYGVSKASSKWLRHFGIISKGEIYNAIDLDRIENIKGHYKGKFRKDHGIPEDSIVVSYTGRLIKEKGIIQLVRAIQEYNNQSGNKLYLCLAGEGPLQSFLDEHTSEFIHYLGRLTFEQVICFLKNSDIFVLPSDSEGFSTSLLEAAACKNYIITTMRGGAKELLPDDTYGIVIENNDLDSVYNAIKDALNHRDQKNATSKAYERVKRNFTWEVTSRKLLEISQSKFLNP